jgi:hypothetical protein
VGLPDATTPATAFGIEVLACAQCGGRLHLIATLHDPSVIRKILAHLAVGHSGPSPGLRPTRVWRRRILIGSVVPSRRDVAARFDAVVCLA